MNYKDLEQQKTFFVYKDKHWYTEDSSYVLIMDNNGLSLYSHCEVYGDVEHIACISSLEELKDAYELITNEKFE